LHHFFLAARVEKSFLTIAARPSFRKWITKGL
jgi:hypothetical protein